MKKTRKGIKIAMIKITGEHIEVYSDTGEEIKTTHAQRIIIMKYHNNKEELILQLKKTFNSNQITDDDLYIKCQ